MTLAIVAIAAIAAVAIVAITNRRPERRPELTVPDLWETGRYDRE